MLPRRGWSSLTSINKLIPINNLIQINIAPGGRGTLASIHAAGRREPFNAAWVSGRCDVYR